MPIQFHQISMIVQAGSDLAGGFNGYMRNVTVSVG